LAAESLSRNDLRVASPWQLKNSSTGYPKFGDQMTLPTILLALVFALLYGTVYHFVRDGNGWRLLLFFGLSILGFFLGQGMGAWLGWYVFMLGSLNLGMGTLGSVALLIGGEWLSRIEVSRESSV
jgi:hypothetical protein